MFEWLRTKTRRVERPITNQANKIQHPFDPLEDSLHLEDFGGCDVSWFASDNDGRIGWFTTGGSGFVPNSVVNAQTSLDWLADYFLTGSHLGERCAAELTDRLNCKDQVLSRKISDRYLEEVLGTAKKGIFCFDAAEVGDFRQICGYDRIAIPISPLTLNDIDGEVASILLGVRLDCSFQESDQLGLRKSQ